MEQSQKYQIDDTDIVDVMLTQNTILSQDMDCLFNISEEAIFYTVIDKKRRKLIDANHLATQRPKTSKVWDYEINAIDSEIKKKYWLCRICMFSKYLICKT